MKKIGIFSVDGNKYKKVKCKELQKVKLDTYFIWNVNGAPAKEDGTPNLSKPSGKS